MQWVQFVLILACLVIIESRKLQQNDSKFIQRVSSNSSSAPTLDEKTYLGHTESHHKRCNHSSTSPGMRGTPLEDATNESSQYDGTETKKSLQTHHMFPGEISITRDASQSTGAEPKHSHLTRHLVVREGTVTSESSQYNGTKTKTFLQTHKFLQEGSAARDSSHYNSTEPKNALQTRHLVVREGTVTSESSQYNGTKTKTFLQTHKFLQEGSATRDSSHYNGTEPKNALQKRHLVVREGSVASEPPQSIPTQPKHYHQTRHLVVREGNATSGSSQSNGAKLKHSLQTRHLVVREGSPTSKSSQSNGTESKHSLQAHHQVLQGDSVRSESEHSFQTHQQGKTTPEYDSLRFIAEEQNHAATKVKLMLQGNRDKLDANHHLTNKSALTNATFTDNHQIDSVSANNGAVFNKQEQSNQTSSNISWGNLVDKEQAKGIFKHVVTDFYPKHILNWVASRAEKNNNGSKTFSPAVVYPFFMETLSVLANHLSGGNSGNESVSSGEPIKGEIALGFVESLEKILNSTKGKQSPLEEKLNSSNSSVVAPTGVLVSKISGLPGLLEKIFNGELGDTMNKVKQFVEGEDPSLFKSLVGGSHVNITEILQGEGFRERLSNFTALTHLASLGSDKINLGTLTKLLQLIAPVQNNLATQNNAISLLAGVLNHSGYTSVSSLLNASKSNRTKSNLSFMDEFLPNRRPGDIRLSPKNPNLRSDFVTKVLSKSPIAHLGALDENIKKLIMASLERAVSRVKIDEKGELQINEGMKKMIAKMTEGKSDQNEVDSLMELLKSSISSGLVNTTRSNGTEAPKYKIVKHHSHLHRRFQEKYGKSCSSALNPWVLSYLAIVFHILTALPFYN